MSIRQLFLVLVVMCLVGIPNIASAVVTQVNDTQQSETFAYTLPANNLIQAGSSTLSNQFDFTPIPLPDEAAIPIGQPTFGGFPALNDGVISLGLPANNNQIVLMDGADALHNPTLYQVFELNLATAPLGYDLTEAAAFASWQGSGAPLDTNNSRLWQNWRIGYNLVGETYSGSGELNHFLPPTTPYQFEQGAGWGTSKVSLTDDTGRLISGVSALEIRWLANGQGGGGTTGASGNLTSYSELALSGTPTLPGIYASGTFTEGVTPPVLPANNLIAQGSSTFTSSFSGGTAPAAFGAQLPGGMNNGVMTDADAAASTILAWDNVTTDFGWAVYQMDTATNPLGYDVSEILSYAGFTGARVNQRVEIKYALVGETVTAGTELSNTLGTFSFAPSDNSTPYAYSTMSIAHNTDPTVLSGISAIEIKYLDNMFDGNTGSVVDPGNFTAYKQFAVIGTPTASGLSGDFDLDGDVDGADFLKWQRDLAPDSVSLAAWKAGFGTGSPLAAAATGVPEPSTLTCLMGLCLTGLWASARRKLF